MTAPVVAAPRAPASVAERPSLPRFRGTLALPAGAVAGVLYLGLGTLVWWHLWASGFGGAVASGSLDPGQNVWWLAWVPHALSHGQNPFFTRAMYFPMGVNVLANTSFLLVGLALSPVTVTAGPVAAFAVAVVLAPALDALVAYHVFRRHVQWAPAAFLGGLVFGFGPFVATDLRYAHLNLTVLVLLPLGLLLLERILVRRTGSPWRAGSWLGLLAAAEFFVSVEMLALGVVVAAVAAVVVAAAGGRRFWEGSGYLWRAAVAAVVVAGVALAYPTWWYLRGPRHFSGAVWGDMAPFSASLRAFVLPHGGLPGVQFLSGGNGAYLGIPLLVVLGAGLVLWRGDRKLRFATAMVPVCAVLAMGTTLHVGRSATGVPLPAWPLLHLPLLSSASANRFSAYTDLFAAWALALVVDHARRSLSAGGRSLALGTAALGLVPAGLVAPWPYPAHPLLEPRVAAALDRLPPGSVVREYPLASDTDADGLVWQAASGLSYAVTAGYAIVPGHNGHAAITPPPDALGLVFAAASLGRLPAHPSAALVDGVRAHAFAGGVAALAIVTPSAGGARLEALFERALGPPLLRGGGALWLAPTLGAGLGR